MFGFFSLFPPTHSQLPTSFTSQVDALEEDVVQDQPASITKEDFLAMNRPAPGLPVQNAGLHDISPFYQYTQWHKVTSTIPEVTALALVTPDPEETERPVKKAVDDWWAVSSYLLRNESYERFGFFVPGSFLIVPMAFKAAFLWCISILISHRFPLLNEIHSLSTAGSDDKAYPFRALEPGTVPTYQRTTTALVLFLTRLAASPHDNLPLAENIKLASTTLTAHANPQNVHLLLMALFSTHAHQPQQPRDLHALGHFMRLSSVRKNRQLAPLSAINHTLVHLVYTARLLAFRQVNLVPAAKDETLKMIKPE